MKKKILVIDDDDEVRALLREQLEHSNDFQVSEAPIAQQGIDMAMTNNHDLIILDVELPDMDGRKACRLMRDKGLKIPILMLTGHDGDKDAIMGLNLGANDYIAKPFRLQLLLARIHAHLRQYEQTSDAVFQLGPYQFHPGKRQLQKEGLSRPIILKYLRDNKGSVISREQLLHEIWGYNPSINTHTLETHIYRLRQKIERDIDEKIILTVQGGYRLNNTPDSSI
jgi:DNA-binding response OmpR family regulator